MYSVMDNSSEHIRTTVKFSKMMSNFNNSFNTTESRNATNNRSTVKIGKTPTPWIVNDVVTESKYRKKGDKGRGQKNS
jgi:hypothetical protein